MKTQPNLNTKSKQKTAPQEKAGGDWPRTPCCASITPGPWKADGYHVRQSGQRGMRMIADVCYTGPHHTPPDEYPKSCRLADEANARLIAAAPDMLDALEYARDEFERLNGAGTCPLEIIHAIETATGINPRHNAERLHGDADACHICHAEFTEETTPGEFCYTCARCTEHVCTACSENDPLDSMRVICDECWTDADDAAFAEESSPSNSQLTDK